MVKGFSEVITVITIKISEYQSMKVLIVSSYTSILLPMILVVFPIPKSFGVSHSLTSSLVVSKTQVGKFAVK